MRSVEVEGIVKSLQAEFPGCNIELIPPDAPREIICEIEPGREKSMAVVYINQSAPHYHSDSTETYTIETGELSLHVAGKQVLLKEGESYTVNPGKVHSASGNWARVRVESVPGWREKDHIPASRRVK